jgi:hypothetical protein
VKRNYKDVELREGGYDGDEPKRGLYPMKLVTAEDHTTSDDARHWVFEITDGPYAGWRGHLYTNSTGAAWKEVQILMATGLLTDPKGNFNMSDAAILKKAGPVRGRVITEEYEGETRGKLTKVLPPGETDAVDNDDADDEDKPKSKAGKKGKKKKEADDPF